MSIGALHASRNTRMSHTRSNVRFTSYIEAPHDDGDENSLTAREAVIASSHRIGFPREQVEKVCKAMDDAYIVNEWQLQYLSSADWRELGAPLGLSTAVMHRFNHDEKAQAARTDWHRRRSSTVPSADAAAMAAQRRWERASVDHRHTGHWRNSSRYSRHQSAYHDQQRQPLVHDGDEDRASYGDRSSRSTRHTVTPPVRLPVSSRMGILKRVSKFLDSLVPFDHQVTFRRGLLHAKNGQDLKDITSCQAEMNLLVFSLLLGCILSLWDKVPEDWAHQQDGELWLFILAAYFAFAGICAVVCLIAILYSVVQLTIGRSVSATHFKTWYLMQSKFMQTAEWSVVIAFYTFLLLLNMRLHFDIHAVLPRYKWIAHGILLGIMGAMAVELLFEVNFISRTTFHTSFGADAEFRTPVDGSSLEEVEKHWYQECFEQMNPSEESTIKALMKDGMDIDLDTEQWDDARTSRSWKKGAGEDGIPGEGSVRTLTGCNRRSEI